MNTIGNKYVKIIGYKKGNIEEIFKKYSDIKISELEEKFDSYCILEEVLNFKELKIFRYDNIYYNGNNYYVEYDLDTACWYLCFNYEGYLSTTKTIGDFNLYPRISLKEVIEEKYDKITDFIVKGNYILEEYELMNLTSNI